MDTDKGFFHFCLILYFFYVALTAISSCFRTTPHGRHSRPGTGLTIPAPLAWFIFESPTLWLTFLLFPLGKSHSNPKSKMQMFFYLFHYFHRTVLYVITLRLKDPSRKTSNGFPITIVLHAFVFNLLNVYVQVRTVTEYTVYEANSWFWWRFVGGMVFFVLGMAINVTSDHALLSLKSQAGGGYKIPRGELFRLVCCPNYFGEIIEWWGWALMTWSWAGLAFFLNSCAYLMPRGIANHKWYLDKFGEDYPKNRKAVIPFVRTVTEYTVYEANSWFWWRFVGGMVLFVLGMAINVTSDHALLSLKSQAGGGYKIPRGGLFELVTCPNYFGEIVEWSGWALMTWSWAGLAFFFSSCSYLMPRGIANHKWYLDKFRDDYPKNRKAVIPFVCCKVLRV